MRGHAPLTGAARRVTRWPAPSFVCRQCRTIQISAAPATETPSLSGQSLGTSVAAARESADARFEVIGSPSSLLSVTLSASQLLYTRRGTLVSVAGKVENAQSTLSVLSPLRRAFLGIPFLYQRVTSTTPITALIGTRSPTSTFSILHLDGTTDWIVGQRNALLAWTGHTLRPTPRIQRSLSLAHWGSTSLTGRGLVALSSPGQIYEMALEEGDQIVLHPSHVVAYAVGRNAPQPFRLRSTPPLRLQVPSLPASVTTRAADLVLGSISRFLAVMRTTETYKFIGRMLYGLRTTARRSLWGDRLFLRFQGPTTILVSSRGVSVAESLSKEEINEIADAEPGTLAKALEFPSKTGEAAGLGDKAGADSVTKPSVEEAADKPVSIHVATVGRNGKVTFEDAKDLKSTVG